MTILFILVWIGTYSPMVGLNGVLGGWDDWTSTEPLYYLAIHNNNVLKSSILNKFVSFLNNIYLFR